MVEMRQKLTDLGCSMHDYLGDGVYCGVDGGGQIWLVVERVAGFHEIALDGDVLAALFRYAQSHDADIVERLVDIEHRWGNHRDRKDGAAEILHLREEVARLRGALLTVLTYATDLELNPQQLLNEISVTACAALKGTA